MRGSDVVGISSGRSEIARIGINVPACTLFVPLFTLIYSRAGHLDFSER